jgi:hypothetical protein
LARVTKLVISKPQISAAVLRLIADAIERDAGRHVAEIRRRADLMDGVKAAAVKATRAKPKKAQKAGPKTAAKKQTRPLARKKPAKPTRGPRTKSSSRGR